MREIVLFIAMSLDGYIADSGGGVDWPGGQGDSGEDFDAYTAFVEDIDTVVMGHNTYRQIVTELSPDEWVYDRFTTYVVTHGEYASRKNIRFVNTSPAALVRELRNKSGKDIWVCGGDDIVRQLTAEDMIDRYYITVIPTLLGSGLRLFEGIEHEIKLRLVKARSYNGMTDLIYVRR